MKKLAMLLIALFTLLVSVNAQSGEFKIDQYGDLRFYETGTTMGDPIASQVKDYAVYNNDIVVFISKDGNVKAKRSNGDWVEQNIYSSQDATNVRVNNTIITITRENGGTVYRDIDGNQK
jgi:hypothetical protein